LYVAEETMASKLTLRMDEDVIRQGKQAARERGKSVSRLVADYFQLLGRASEEESRLPPITRSLVGIAAGSELDEEDFRRYQERKHG
jgi:hypothetical protein